MQKIFKISILSLSGIGILMWILLLGSIDPYADIMFYLSYILILIAAGTVLVFSIKHIIGNPKLLKKTIILMSSFLLVFLISYLLSDSTPLKGSTETQASMVDTGLFMFYTLLFLSVLVMMYFAVLKMLNK